MRLGLLYHFIKGFYGFRIVPGWEEKSLFNLLSAQNSNFDSLGLIVFPLYHTVMDLLQISLCTRRKSGFQSTEGSYA